MYKEAKCEHLGALENKETGSNFRSSAARAMPLCVYARCCELGKLWGHLQYSVVTVEYQYDTAVESNVGGTRRFLINHEFPGKS